MPEPERRRGRAHDAEGAREAILNAAEIVFAEHGFDGARIDAIAAQAGYNKSLLFHYFGDKLGLYAEIVKRADQETSELQQRSIAPLLADESTPFDAHRFRTALETAISLIFDYLLEHPRMLRIFNWEQAEGWQTYIKMASQLNTEDMEQGLLLTSKAQQAGLLRPGVDPLLLFLSSAQMCMAVLSSLPLYQAVLPGRDFSSATAIANLREQIVKMVVAAMMPDQPETTP